MPSTANSDANSDADADSDAAPSAPLAAAAAPAFSPLYRQIKALIIRSLQEGAWAPGAAIPSEMELAARYKVSQGTVRKAIDELAADNLLVRRQGKGTFVPTHAQQEVQYRFLRLYGDDGRVVGRADRRFIDCRRMKAQASVAAALQLNVGDAVIQVRRVLSFGGSPVVFDDIWLPGQLFKGLSTERLRDDQGPMYRLFESEFNVQMIRAEEQIRAVAAAGMAAEVLNVPAGTPLLSLERLSLTYGERPVELRHGQYVTSHHHYRTELS